MDTGYGNVIDYDETYFRFQEFLNAHISVSVGRGSSKDLVTMWNYTIETALKTLVTMLANNFRIHTTVYLCPSIIERRKLE